MAFNRKLGMVITSVLGTFVAIWLFLNLTLGDKQVDTRLNHQYAVADEQFPRTMSYLLTPALVSGNRVEELLNGAQIFDAMLQEIHAARTTINLETYIFWSGSIGRVFSDALIQAAKRGVKVKLMLDWIGGQLDDEALERMRDNGIEIRRYNAPHRLNLKSLNNRTHRKLLIVDGQVGFIGGVGIADHWRGHAQDPSHWRDTHYRMHGPVVGQIQSAFVDNWMQATGELLHGHAYFPPPQQAGTLRAQVFTSSPGGGAESMQLMYLLSIAAATESIYISASYFIPDNVAVDTLVSALMRGVKVKIILPGPYIDFELVRRASRATWGRLLTAGAEIYEYQPTMYHVKTLIVDSQWVSVGSTNFDNRSFSINDEANLNIYDKNFAKKQMAIFESDLQESRRVTYEEWLRRSLANKLLDWGASLLSSQL